MKGMGKWIPVIFLVGFGPGMAGAECTESSETLFRRPASLSSPAQPGADTNKWGYGYDSLLKDLDGWGRNPLVKVDSIGASVQGRAIWSVRITEGDDSIAKPGDPAWRKRRVFVHARTHPAEVQAHHIAKAMIAFLLDTTALAREIRREHIFNIIPMYNPDGVELGFPRENANKVDIESNWNKPVVEPEVQVLKRHFELLMASHIPVEVALNLHSDRFNCTRFFFFHEAGGTSPAYVELEKDFIGKVRGHFPSGIEDWFFVRSWGTATGTQYPEGFWWVNHREKVMALTYEDTNCPGAGEYDRTAMALVRGSVDYLRPRTASLMRWAKPETFLLRENGGYRVVDVRRQGLSDWSLLDATGRTLGRGRFEGGTAFIPAGSIPSRTAILRVSGADARSAARMILPAATP